MYAFFVLFSLFLIKFQTIDSDQSQCFVGSDLGPNCLQRVFQSIKPPLPGKRVNLIFSADF